MAGVRIELRFGWISLLGAAAAAYYLRPTDDSFKPVLNQFIKQSVGLPVKMPSSGSLLDNLANKVADVAVSAVAEHGIKPEIKDYYVCKVAGIRSTDVNTGKEGQQIWIGAFGAWLRFPLAVPAQYAATK